MLKHFFFLAKHYWQGLDLSTACRSLVIWNVTELPSQVLQIIFVDPLHGGWQGQGGHNLNDWCPAHLAQPCLATFVLCPVAALRNLNDHLLPVTHH